MNFIEVMLIDLLEQQVFRDVCSLFCFFNVCIQTMLQQCLCCHFHADSDKDLPVLGLKTERGFGVNPYFEETFLTLFFSPEFVIKTSISTSKSP